MPVLGCRSQSLCVPFSPQVRWGKPGVTCDMSVIGSVSAPASPGFPPLDVWIDVGTILTLVSRVRLGVAPLSRTLAPFTEFNMMVSGSQRVVTFQDDLQQSGSFPTGDGWTCAPFFTAVLPGNPLPIVATLDMCVHFDGVAVRNGGDVADINGSVVVNVTYIPGRSQVTLWSGAYVSPDNDCRMLSEVYTIVAVCVLCLAAPVLTWLYWPLPKPEEGEGEKPVRW